MEWWVFLILLVKLGIIYLIAQSMVWNLEYIKDKEYKVLYLFVFLCASIIDGVWLAMLWT